MFLGLKVVPGAQVQVSGFEFGRGSEMNPQLYAAMAFAADVYSSGFALTKLHSEPTCKHFSLVVASNL